MKEIFRKRKTLWAKARSLIGSVTNGLKPVVTKETWAMAMADEIA